MKGFVKDNNIYTSPDWFVAKITDVGDKVDDTSNFPCSWIQYNFVDDMQIIDEDSEQILHGNHNDNYNTAYPISQSLPTLGSIVLMRLRGTVNDFENVFEFVEFAGYQPKLALTAIQCSGDILSTTYSEGCVSQ